MLWRRCGTSSTLGPLHQVRNLNSDVVEMLVEFCPASSPSADEGFKGNCPAPRVILREAHSNHKRADLLVDGRSPVWRFHLTAFRCGFFSFGLPFLIHWNSIS